MGFFIALGNFCESEVFFLGWGHKVCGGGGRSLPASCLPTGG